MWMVAAVGKKGKAPGELYGPHAVAIDSNDRIFVAEEGSSSNARSPYFQ